MDGLFLIFAILAALVGFDVLAARFGVDSREQSSDPRTNAPGITL
jgi:hypothetical protein